MFNNRLVVIFFGWVGNEVMVWGFDYLLYPFVIYKMGALKGGIVMTVLSFITCLFTLAFYNYSKKDWLGIETIKKFREEKPRNKFQQYSAYLLNKSEFVALLFLSIRFDPFITTLYLRHGAFQYKRMNKRDWRIFLSSVVISNLFWIALMDLGIEFFKRIF